MKKLISFILAASIMSGALVAVNAQTFTDVTDSKAIDVVTGLGLMDGNTDGTFSPDNNLTRAEFAQIVADIYNYGEEDNAAAEWKKNFFEGVFEDETALIPPEVMNAATSELYSDVLEGSDSYDAISLVTSHGIMRGVGNGEFAPEDNITGEQALKVLVTMLGYGSQAQIKGGYPKGYTQTASSLGISKGVNNLTSYLTKEDVAQILYNSLDVPVMQMEFVGSNPYYTTYEGDTFSTKLLNIDYDKGRMTSNGFTTLSGEAYGSDDDVVIAGRTYSLDENTKYVRDYLGREVEVYYSLDDDADGFIFACLSGRDESVKIDISEFEAYTGDKFRYCPKDGNKYKDLTVVNAPYVIKNGSAISGINDSLFDFNYGSIELIKPVKENRFDLIVVKEANNFNIDIHDAGQNIIYSQASLLGNIINIDSEEREVRIYDAAGNKASAETLKSGTVTTIYNGEKIVEIYISDKTETKFIVKGITTGENGEYIVKGEKQSYELSKDYCEINPGVLPKIGSTYTLKLDIFDCIVDFKESAGEVVIAFMNDVKVIDNEETGVEELRIKFYDLTTKTIQTVYAADKVKVVKKDDTAQSYSLDKAIDALQELLYDGISETIENVKTKTGSMIRYKMNEEGKINWIELPGVQEDSLDNSSRLVEIKTNSTGTNNKMYNGSSLYGGKIIINKNTKIIQCNYASNKFMQDNGYSIISSSDLYEGRTYDFKSYSTTKNSPVAEYVIYTNDPTQVISTDQPQTCVVVEDIYTGLNEDDEPIDYIVFGSKEYEVAQGVCDEGNVTNMQGATSYKDARGISHYFKVEKGDIIRYALDADKAISQIQLVYDANADYSDGITINNQVYSGWSKRGNLAGCIAGFDKNVYSFSNPFSANSTASGNSFSSDPYTWAYYNGNMRVMLGSVLRTGDGYIITTTRNLAENPGDVDMNGDGYYATNIYNVNSVKVVTVSKRSVSVTTEGVSSLKSYAVAGSDCDRIFITSRIGSAFNAIVYRYE